jgi:uncharacterized membrane protein YfcA
VPELSSTQWAVVGLCAAMQGVAKTGVPGVGILAVPLMAMVFGAEEAKGSVGLLLGILILADVFAITYHRKNAQWRHVLRLLPATAAGIATGSVLLGQISGAQLKPLIGVIVLAMLVLNYWRQRKGGAEVEVPRDWWFAGLMGFAAGVATMMANAAGPVMIIYLLAMQLPKVQFVGTSAWFFFLVNWIKVPFSVNLKMMTFETLKVDLMMLPAIALGALLGVVLLHRIPQKKFGMVMQVLAAAAAIKLLIPDGLFR